MIEAWRLKSLHIFPWLRFSILEVWSAKWDFLCKYSSEILQAAELRRGRMPFHANQPPLQPSLATSLKLKEAAWLSSWSPLLWSWLLWNQLSCEELEDSYLVPLPKHPLPQSREWCWQRSLAPSPVWFCLPPLGRVRWRKPLGKPLACPIAPHPSLLRSQPQLIHLNWETALEKQLRN